MTFRSRYWLAAALGVCVAHSPAHSPPSRLVWSLSPAGRCPPPSPKISESPTPSPISCGKARPCTVIASMCSFQAGVVSLTGAVADAAQREEVLRITHGVPGVERVLDRLTIASAVTPARADEPAPIVVPPTPLPVPNVEPPPVRRNDGPLPGAAGAPPVEPAPMFQAPAPSPYDLNPPKMPPYAWPTYAPYNNYSRVAYPLAYPYNAWPFIGPCYPFPKVPLGCAR